MAAGRVVESRGLVVIGQLGALGIVLALPLIDLLNILTWPGAGSVVPMTVCTALCLALLAAIVWPAVSGRRIPAAGRLLAAMAVLMVLATLWVGRFWLYEYAALGLALLLVLPRPWSWTLFLLVGATALTLAWVLDFESDVAAVLALYAFKGLAPLLLIRYVTTIRSLQTTAQALAVDARARERIRAAEDLRATVQTDLTRILVLAETATTHQQFRDITSTSRSSLARTRRLIAQYRQGSLSSDVDAAARLLQAAGIRVSIENPASGDESLRDELKRAVEGILSTPGVTACTISFARGRLHVEVSP
ncbi:hypothetical protein AB0E69_25910 [Kribbella sp. NPDC026611]|uniref:hypothetical protein n=1 Tax=Kribbella sp. NPDC026611 TaxID=3154911 RepID=UPI0033D90F5C